MCYSIATNVITNPTQFDNKQRAQGQPTSDELRKVEMLEKFKKQHPEMDFSQVRVEKATQLTTGQDGIGQLRME